MNVRCAVRATGLVLLASLAAAAPAPASFPGRNGDIAVISTTMERIAGTCVPSETQSCWSSNDPHLVIRRDLVFVTIDGAVRRRLPVSPEAGTFSGSPDGRRLVYESRGGVWISELDGGHRRRVVPRGTSPAWAPDGRRITYVRDRSIWVVGSNGKSRRRLTSGARDGSPAWSPDGRTIAFIRAVKPSSPKCVDESHVFSVPARGGRARRLFAPGFVCGGVYSFDWSPNATRMVLAVTDNTSGSGPPEPRAAARLGIVVVRADGTGRRRLVDGGLAPAWAPDGTRIVYVDARCRAPQGPVVAGPTLCSVRAGGGDARHVADVRDDIGALYPPTWLVRPR